MNNVENARARAEALSETPDRALRSARRAALWEGLNRYLASEASHEQKVAEQAAAAEEPEEEPGSKASG
jgi:hypothetical protein